MLGSGCFSPYVTLSIVAVFGIPIASIFSFFSCPVMILKYSAVWGCNLFRISSNIAFLLLTTFFYNGAFLTNILALLEHWNFSNASVIVVSVSFPRILRWAVIFLFKASIRGYIFSRAAYVNVASGLASGAFILANRREVPCGCRLSTRLYEDFCTPMYLCIVRFCRELLEHFPHLFLF